MFDLIITGTVGGAVGGGITAWTIARTSRRHQPNDDSRFADPFVDASAQLAAERWANETGRSGYAPFLAEKLKLLSQLGDREIRAPRRLGRRGQP